MSIQQENFKNIADAIRAKTGETEPIAPSTFAAAIGNVYESGFEAGQNSMYDRFWDAFQQNGTRTNYDYGFYGRQWTKDILKPKHRIAPTSANQMFINNNYKGDLRELGVELDFSACTNVSNLFAYANQITHIGKVDMSSATSIAGAFVSCTALISIDEVVFASNGSQAPGTSIFKNCSALESIKVSGMIGQSISFGDSKKLSKESTTSIINALSSSVSGNSVSLSKDAVIEAFRSGINLLSEPYVDSTKVENGITFTDNGDGTITANGTATADATFSVKVFKTTPNDSFALVGCPIGGSASTYYIAYEGYGRDYGNGVMWDGSRDFWDTVIIVIKKGTKVSSLNFAPQINNINEWKMLIATKDNWTINLL